MKNLTLTLCLLLLYVDLANAQGRTATVISERANLRETPSQIGEVKQEVPIGTSIKILDHKGAWYVVRVDDLVGWMHGNTFRYGDAALAPPATNSSSVPPVIVEFPHTAPAATPGLIRGPRGGCYHYSKSGKKVYVDRSLCN